MLDILRLFLFSFSRPSIRGTRDPDHHVRVWGGEARGQAEAQQEDGPPVHLLPLSCSSQLVTDLSIQRNDTENHSVSYFKVIYIIILGNSIIIIILITRTEKVERSPLLLLYSD